LSDLGLRGEVELGVAQEEPNRRFRGVALERQVSQEAAELDHDAARHQRQSFLGGNWLKRAKEVDAAQSIVERPSMLRQLNRQASAIFRCLPIRRFFIVKCTENRPLFPIPVDWNC
jgi:hypothetical protein